MFPTSPDIPSSDPDRSSGPSVAHRYLITATPELSVLSRVLELFVIRDAAPIRITSEMTVGNDPVQEIEVEVAGLEDRMARHLTVRIQQFPSVHTVSMHERGLLTVAA